ncbi:integrase catalytic domain-containing protein [Trichonephila inaurata madagascariensis]|uniref:Integrase catalytic domain-containing protein n=1 Tax=Trichonephila inaurata madagascariensis TaxID=2747483 RepID=A0A8X7C734_9ARAC|nr:integrase catalytic domain-containing protein [Trichonephila inaurata madagascariensis]
MNALKLRRTPLRTAFTKTVNHLQEISKNDHVDMNAVETAFEQVKIKSTKLKEVEDDVLELMIESNCTQEAYNIEFEAIEGYAEKNDCLASPRKKYHEDRCFGTEGQPQPGYIFIFASDVKCIICNKWHYPVLCSKLPLRSGLETESASVENSTTASSSSSNVLANQACTSEVLLQTLVVVLQNGNHKSLVRALIDTGSQKSYILKSTAENLGFKYEEEEEFVHSLFGGSKTKRGWQSNVLLNPEKFSELESQPDNFETMVLGLIWNLKDDCLSCNINCQKNEGKAITKRSLLSIANHIFDPIGFTAPVTLKPKLILQEISKLKWDENLPENILNQVKQWLEQLPILAGIKIPRCLNLSSNGIKQITLHVFCDASKNAYAACVFLRVEYEENVFVKLIQAKARVAPFKDISIPRLELLDCTFGARLAASVKNDLNLPDVRIYYLTDSMTALAWIQRTRDWGVFVFNRVKEIRNLSDVSSWEHVPSKKNLADILSRGCSSQQLIYLRWWERPTWLSENPVQCPRSKQVPDEGAINLVKEICFGYYR